MNKQSFTQLVSNKTHITDSDSDAIEDVMKSYPFCQSAYLLIAKAHSEKGSMFTNQKVRKSSLFASSRTKLKHILSEEFQIEADQHSADFSEVHSNKSEINIPTSVELKPATSLPIIEDKIIIAHQSKAENDALINEIEHTLIEIKANKIYKEEKKKFNESHHIVSENENELVNLHPVFPSEQIISSEPNIKVEHEIKFEKDVLEPKINSYFPTEKTLIIENKIPQKVIQPKITDRDIVLSEIEQSLNELKSNKIYLEEKKKYQESHQKSVQNTEHIQTALPTEVEANSILETKIEDQPINSEPIQVNKFYVHSPEFGNEVKEAKGNVVDEYLTYRSSGFDAKPKLDEQLNIIQKFIEIEPSISRSMEAGDLENKVDLSEESTVENNFMISENYANLLIRQGKIEKAKLIFQQLIQKYPDKTVHYNDRIYALGV